MTPELIVTLVFLFVSVSIVALYTLFAGRRAAVLKRQVGDRLQEVSGLMPAADSRADSLIRAQASGPLPTVDRVARQTARGSALERWLEQSGVRISISAVFLVSIVSAVVLGFVGTVLSNRGWVGVTGGVLGFVLPLAGLRQKRGARMRKFEEFFPEALDLMARALRAGHAFSAGLKMVADELSDPVGPEFRKAFDEQNFGLPLKESLNNLADRVPLLDVRFFATAVLIQRETGGNLAEILDNLANVVRERFKIRRQVRVHTAHGRFTGYVLLALPAFLALALSVINPEHMEMLFQDPIGHALIVGAIVMQAIGFLWIKQVVKIEV
jgi:tight adherence protein B